jgi:hypothetical protein
MTRLSKQTHRISGGYQLAKQTKHLMPGPHRHSSRARKRQVRKGSVGEYQHMMISSGVQYEQIERRSGISVEDFRRYKAQCKPVVLTDVMSNWRALDWTWNGLSERYGTTEINVSLYNHGWYKASDSRQMSLKSFIEGALTADWQSFPFYVRDSWELFGNHPELTSDCPVPPHFFDWFSRLPGLSRPYPRLFIGPSGAITPLHVDIWETHSWLTQLVGRKRWVLISPHDRQFLASVQRLGKGLTKYAVDPENPDFPKTFPRVRPLEYTLGPGETIFVPSGWAHHVRSLESGISITGNFLGPGGWKAGLRAIRSRLVG